MRCVIDLLRCALGLSIILGGAGCVSTTAGTVPAPAAPLTTATSEEGYYQFSLGVQAELAGNYPAAVDHLTRALRYDTAAAGIYEELGSLYLQLGRPREALAAYAEVLAQDPDNYAVLLRAGSAHLALARHADALRCFTRAAADTQDRREGKAQFYVAVTNTMRGDYPAATAAYARYLALIPDDAVAWYNLAVLHDEQREDSAAAAAFARVLALEPSSTRALARLAALRRAAGDNHGARDLARRAVELEPALTAHRLLLADIALDLGENDEAVRQYRLILQQTPHDIRAQFKLGLAYARQQNYLLATAALRRCLELDPGMLTPYVELGYLYQVQGDHAASAEVFRAALTIEPHNARLHELLGLTYIALHDTPAARGALQQAIRLAPGAAAGPYYQLAGLDWRDGQFAAAEAGYRAALAVDPDYAPALNDLGYLYVERNENLAQARVYLTRAVALVPDNACYLDSLGWLEFRAGNYAAAAAHLERAAVLDTDAEITFHLGEAYFALGRLADAKAAWERSLARRDDPRVRQRLSELPDVRGAATP